MNKQQDITYIKKLLVSLGVSKLASSVYLALLQIGEGSIQDIGAHAKVPRTSIYYSINELLEKSMITKVLVLKKTVYRFVEPDKVVEMYKQHIFDLDAMKNEINGLKFSVFKKPSIEFYYGSSGFKQAWKKIVETKSKLYRHMSNPVFFAEFLKQKEIFSFIINYKRKHGVSSKQLITDSPVSREIQKRDRAELRSTRFLPKGVEIDFMEVITDDSVFFISHKEKNFIFEVRDVDFANTRRTIFEATFSLSPVHNVD
ncbi:MAG: helix-turn-helix domain-containing protein [Patescibacteria group bacterium]